MQKNLDFYNLSISATHKDGRGEIFHDWYPYLEGFSSQFVMGVMNNFMPKSSKLLEPFSGVGTTPCSLWMSGIDCDYCEVNPFLQSLISIKYGALNNKKNKYLNLLKSFEREFDKIGKYKEDVALFESYSNLFKNSKYFDLENFSKILKTKSIIRNIDKTRDQFLSVLVSSVLLKSSLLKRSGDIRFKTQRELLSGVPDFYDLVKQKISLVEKDILKSKQSKFEPGSGVMVADNAKKLIDIELDSTYDGVITSPPYLNGTNYIRNTKLELWFCEFIGLKGVGLRNYRDEVVTSGINDVSKTMSRDFPSECHDCVSEIQSNCYDQRIPLMVGSYFKEMKQCFLGFKKLCKNNSKICIDIGDSIYNQVHVPTDKILIEIMKNIGNDLEESILIRKRYSNNGQPLSQCLLVFNNSK